MSTPGWVYILRCADGTCYVGSTTNLHARLYEHETGADPSAYTFSRRPVELAWCEQCPTIEEAWAFEHQVHGWSRAKKEALIRREWAGIHEIVKQERQGRERRKRGSRDNQDSK